MSAQPAAPKSTSNAKTTKSNKTIRKPSTLNTNQPSSSKQQLLNKQNDSTQALREDLLNLRVSMQSETAEDETQVSASSQTEGKRDQNTAQAEHKESKYNAVFWDIEVAKDLPITMSTEHIFGTFDPAADKDVLIPMGAVAGILPGWTEYECNWLRSAIELVYNTLKDCRWESLGDAIQGFTSHEVSKDDLVRYSGQGIFHGVERNQLLQVSQVVVSVDQVLQVLVDFFFTNENGSILSWIPRSCS